MMWKFASKKEQTRVEEVEQFQTRKWKRIKWAGFKSCPVNTLGASNIVNEFLFWKIHKENNINTLVR